MKTQRELENPVSGTLSPEARRTARELWASLMPAASPGALLAARQELQQAPAEVRDAVTTAIALVWARGKDASSVPNPFE